MLKNGGNKRLRANSGSRLSVSVGQSSARSVKGSSSTQRGYGYKWQKKRAAFLAANPLCAKCSTDEHPVPATVLDHIKPHRGDDALFWDESNWQGLCAHCHSSAKQREEKNRGKWVGGVKVG